MAKRPVESTADQHAAEIYEEYARIESGTFQVLSALEQLVSTAHDYLGNRARTESLTAIELGGKSKLVYRLRFTPAQRLIADYVAFQTYEPYPERSGAWLDWIQREIARSRESLIILSRRPFASAFRATRYIWEETLPIPHNPFRIDDLFGCLRWAVIWAQRVRSCTSRPPVEAVAATCAAGYARP